MCHSHSEQAELTQEYLNSLAALAHYKMPSEEELTASVLPHGWQIEEGQTPAPYRAELYRDETGGGIAQGTFRAKAPAAAPRRATTDDPATLCSRLHPSLCLTPSSITTPIWICLMAK